MRRRFAPLTEIIRRVYQSAAEMPQPYTIHHDSRGERILRIRDPIREQSRPLPL